MTAAFSDQWNRLSQSSRFLTIRSRERRSLSLGKSHAFANSHTCRGVCGAFLSRVRIGGASDGHAFDGGDRLCAAASRRWTARPPAAPARYEPAQPQPTKSKSAGRGRPPAGLQPSGCWRTSAGRRRQARRKLGGHPTARLASTPARGAAADWPPPALAALASRLALRNRCRRHLSLGRRAARLVPCPSPSRAWHALPSGRALPPSRQLVPSIHSLCASLVNAMRQHQPGSPGTAGRASRLSPASVHERGVHEAALRPKLFEPAL